MIPVQTAPNRILASLPQAERGLILSLCDEVGLRLGDAIDEVGEPVRYLYFPLDAAISVMDVRNEQHILEVMVIGKEGCSGSSVVQGSYFSTTMSMVDTAGAAVRTAASRVREHLPDMPALQVALAHYHALLLRYTELASGCNRSHAAAQQVARWLKTHRDRTGSESFLITTAFLAAKVGISLETTAEVLDDLQRHGIVSRGYNKITIIDEVALDDSACECIALRKRAMEDYLAGLADLSQDS